MVFVHQNYSSNFNSIYFPYMTEKLSLHTTWRISRFAQNLQAMPAQNPLHIPNHDFIKPPNPSKPVQFTTAKFRFMNITHKILALHRHMWCIHTIIFLKGPHHKEHYGKASRTIEGYLETVQLDISSEIWKTVNQCIWNYYASEDANPWYGNLVPNFVTDSKP